MKKESARLFMGVAIFLGAVSCGDEGQMQEPDRTITIVSIIGLIIIWGSVLYHKFVQGGGHNTSGQEADSEPARDEEPESALEEAEHSQSSPPAEKNKGPKGKKKGKKRS